MGPRVFIKKIAIEKVYFGYNVEFSERENFKWFLKKS